MGLSLSNHFYNFEKFFSVGPLRAANRNYTIFCLFVCVLFFVVLGVDDGDKIAIITSHLFILFFFSFSGKMTAICIRKQFVVGPEDKNLPKLNLTMCSFLLDFTKNNVNNGNRVWAGDLFTVITPQHM